MSEYNKQSFNSCQITTTSTPLTDHSHTTDNVFIITAMSQSAIDPMASRLSHSYLSLKFNM